MCVCVLVCVCVCVCVWFPENCSHYRLASHCSRSSLDVRLMVCARCGQWIENQWLFWRYWPPYLFLPRDVQFVSPTHAGGVSYFFCAGCTIAKYENEGWTPGTYENEDGNQSTDDEDEYFLCRCVQYSRSVVDECYPVTRHPVTRRPGIVATAAPAA